MEEKSEQLESTPPNTSGNSDFKNLPQDEMRKSASDKVK